MTADLLLDTHAYVWARAAPQRLTAAERRLLSSARRVRVSAASLWEVAILGMLGRIDDVDALLEPGAQYELLAVEPAHCRRLLALPPLHRDRFDRRLIAQARLEEVPLLTRDAAILAYGASGARIAGVA